MKRPQIDTVEYLSTEPESRGAYIGNKLDWNCRLELEQLTAAATAAAASCGAACVHIDSSVLQVQRGTMPIRQSKSLQQVNQLTLSFNVAISCRQDQRKSSCNCRDTRIDAKL